MSRRTVMILFVSCLLPLFVSSFQSTNNVLYLDYNKNKYSVFGGGSSSRRRHHTLDIQIRAISSKLLLSSNNNSNNEQQAFEAIQSWKDFHTGIWICKDGAKSFTITNDIAAGIIKRKTSSQYKVIIDKILQETIQCDNNTIQRKLQLSSTMDIDSVDASYSLDFHNDDDEILPKSILGMDDTETISFIIEHCIATSEITRARCFVLYDDNEQLARIVLCEEERSNEQGTKSSVNNQQQGNDNILTAQDLIEMQSDVDRLVDKITGNMKQGPDNNRNNGNTYQSLVGTSEMSSNNNNIERLQTAISDNSSSSTESKLTPHTISLLEISSGIWLGDAVIRDLSYVPMSPLQQKTKGFAKKKQVASFYNDNVNEIPFGTWNVGVQKIAWRYMWNFNDEIRNVIDIGKAMGSEILNILPNSLAGTVCINESLSRRIPTNERMVYIDWESDNVSFLSGCMSIQVPRYLKFDQTRRLKPFYTEFCYFQKEDTISTSSSSSNNNDDIENMKLPEVICSKISRVYNYKGHLRQGVTSFFTLKRFGIDDNDDESTD